jgi:hypothetical protein
MKNDAQFLAEFDRDLAFMLVVQVHFIMLNDGLSTSVRKFT